MKKPAPLIHDEPFFGRIGVPERNELAFDLHSSIVGGPRKRHRSLTVVLKILENGRGYSLRHEGDEVPALIFYADRRYAATVGPKGRISRSKMDGEALFQEFREGFIEHLVQKQADYTA